MEKVIQVYQNWYNLSASEQAEFLANTPGLAPPAGQVSNFVNPPNRNDIGYSVVIIFLVLVIITGLLRLYSKVAVVRVYRLEDYLGFASYIPFIALSAILLHVSRWIGFMVDMWNVSLGTSNHWSMWLWIYRLIYALVMLLAKTAILLEWKNLFVPNKRRNWFFWATTVMIAINVIAYSVAIIMTCLRCRPVAKIWQPWLEGHCSNLASQKRTDVATTFINLAMDVVILLLPQPIIWKLNMTRERRIGVSLVFSLGIFVVVCAAGRIHSNIVLDYLGNTTRGGAINLIWSYGESTFVMLVWAAPGIPRAFTNQTLPARVLHTLRSWTRLGDGSKQNSGGSGRSKRSNGLVQTIGGGSGKPRKGPTATELDLIETQNADHLEAGYGHQDMRVSEGWTPENGIWKTTFLETQEDSASKKSTEPIVGRQHPWDDNKRW